MKRSFNSLKNHLFLWYIFSLILLGIFIILVVHVFALKNGIYFIALLFVTLALFGFTIIYKITRSLTYLSSRMKMISEKNLDERILGIQRTDEIGELSYTFNELLDRLHEAFKREQQFIADVAHELKTPLATLRSTLEVALQQKRRSEEYQKTLKDGLDETNKITSTLKNVLDLAWSETPAEQKNAKLFNLTELIEEVFDTAQKMSIKKKLSVIGSFEKKVVTFGFKDKLGRAILNVIDNAIKYTSARGKIEMLLKKENDQAVVTVRDTGPGISQHDLPHIFDRFYRGAKSEKVFGSGLGLAIAKAIIVSHHGAIHVKSKIGQGSTFSIVLPIV